jgi:hypothetical protein
MTLAGLVLSSLFLSGRARADETIQGQVLGGGAPIANSKVTLYAATTGEPKQLAQTKTDNQGRFEVRVTGAPADSSLYLLAFGGEPKVRNGGDNPAIALLAVLGNKPPAHVVLNEMTTVASVWTNAQFLVGATLKGPALGLRIAAGNVPNFVDLSTGGWGEAIQSPLNSGQTPTMANFATLADLLSACVTGVTANACSSLFAAATPPGGGAPTDTVNTPEAIALNPWYRPERLYALLDQFYPVPKGKNMRPVPFMPYLNYAPSAWVLPLKFDGGGYRAGGKCMFDSEGNLWWATTSASAGRAATRCGRAMRPSSRQTAIRCRPSPRDSLAAEWREEHSAPQWIPKIMPGSRPTAARPSPSSIRMASR